MKQAKRARYTLEYKLEAVRLVEGGQSLTMVSKTLGIAEQTLHNWVKAKEQNQLKEIGKPVSKEQMEITRLRAELAQTKMERDILKKAAAYFAKESM